MDKFMLLLLLMTPILLQETQAFYDCNNTCACVAESLNAPEKLQCDMGAAGDVMMLSLEELKSSVALEFSSIRNRMSLQMKLALQKSKAETQQDKQEAATGFKSMYKKLENSTAVLMNQNQQMREKMENDSRTMMQTLEETSEDIKNTTALEVMAIIKNQTQEIKEQINTALQNLKDALMTEMTAIKDQLTQELAPVVEKIKFCSTWTATLRLLNVKKLLTGSYYYYIDSSKNHSDASAWCINHGMRLGVIETIEELNLLLEHAPKPSAYWLDASDVGNSPGDFKWRDGTKVNHNHFGGSSPNAYGAAKQACVGLSAFASERKLYDNLCSAQWYFICEVDKEFWSCL